MTTPVLPGQLSWAAVAPRFVAIDDRTRGGLSTSTFEAATAPSGQLGGRFSGFIDTTTVGYAGFTSRSLRPFPVSLSSPEHSGITLSFIATPPASLSHLTSAHFESIHLAHNQHPHIHQAHTVTAVHLAQRTHQAHLAQVRAPSNPPNAGAPGGGKHGITSYILSFKTGEVLKQRKNGVRTSTISYQLAFDVNPGAPTGDMLWTSKPITIEAPWSSFVPTYRGKRVSSKSVLPFDPSQIKEVTFIARSYFKASVTEQSGPFELYIMSMDALPRNHEFDPALAPLRRYVGTVSPFVKYVKKIRTYFRQLWERLTGSRGWNPAV
ncbi:hypothetical protein BS47DRAFT_1383824 [Hydnum rufescens UP504]|uniref:NADH:ubiquinone oxidoreductase intermediate-associated protein 30 domain-containing protein n=1 Tax=Hydnum rufescens UP504 TaxID=1448309 RepID=A0A9P6ARL7_9AGAM|nr:hypothetical protein BS47DRAFT_1383824 [Hydnum rufescens UP504]